MWKSFAIIEWGPLFIAIKYHGYGPLQDGAIPSFLDLTSLAFISDGPMDPAFVLTSAFHWGTAFINKVQLSVVFQVHLLLSSSLLMCAIFFFVSNRQTVTRSPRIIITKALLMLPLEYYSFDYFLKIQK